MGACQMQGYLESVLGFNLESQFQGTGRRLRPWGGEGYILRWRHLRLHSLLGAGHTLQDVAVSFLKIPDPLPTPPQTTYSWARATGQAQRLLLSLHTHEEEPLPHPPPAITGQGTGEKYPSKKEWEAEQKIPSGQI